MAMSVVMVMGVGMNMDMGVGMRLAMDTGMSMHPLGMECAAEWKRGGRQEERAASQPGAMRQERARVVLDAGGGPGGKCVNPFPVPEI